MALEPTVRADGRRAWRGLCRCWSEQSDRAGLVGWQNYRGKEDAAPMVEQAYIVSQMPQPAFNL